METRMSQHHNRVSLNLTISQCLDLALSDTLAEWLRRRPAEPMGSPCVGSNPTGVVSLCYPRHGEKSS